MPKTFQQFTDDEKQHIQKELLKYLPWITAFLVIICLSFTKQDYDKLQPAIQSISWPKTSGTITHSSLESYTAHSKGSLHINIYYRVNIQYKYPVDRMPYYSSQISLARWANSSAEQRSYYAALKDQFFEGKHINVYYNPIHPEQSVLLPGVVPEAVSCPGILFLCLTLLLIVTISIGCSFQLTGHSGFGYGLLIVIIFSIGVILVLNAYKYGAPAFVRAITPKEALTMEGEPKNCDLPELSF